MSGLRLTRDGWWVIGLTSGALLIALQTGNNLVYLVASALIAIVILAPVLATWNLRGLAVERTLPEEFYSGVDARGAFVLINPRRWGTAVAVHVEDVEHAASAILVAAVEVGNQAYAPTAWRFEERGAHTLCDVRLSSTFPFGLVERWRVVESPAALVIYAKPRAGLWQTETGDLGQETGRGQSIGSFGDFSGLREYQAGDAIRSIHWRTTARLAQPIVVVRTGEGARQLVVAVSDRHGKAWETEISRATGQVLRAFQKGCAVGLQLPDQRFEARDGGTWRRNLLEVLATLPARFS